MGAPAIALSVIALGVVGYLMLIARDHRRWDAAGWRQLERLSPELVGQLDETAILRIALADSLVLLRCQMVMVVLYARPGLAGVVASLADIDDAQVAVRSLPPGHPIPEAASGTSVAPLFGYPEQIGELRVLGGSRSGRRVRGRLVRGLAHLVASSLYAERMFQRQREIIDETYQRTLCDELTGLGNRALLNERGNRDLTRSEAVGRCSAMFLLDLDGFKQINDTLGHAAGDRVLVEVGRRITAVLRDSDLAVRLGGDEFAILAGGLHRAEDAERLTERIVQSFRAPVVIDDVRLQVFASIGVAVHGQDGDTVEELLAAADEAMYAAKAGSSKRHAVLGTTSRPPADAVLAHRLRDGLPADELVVHYQPQVDAVNEQIRGYEALLRWSHPDLGLLKPDDFLPLAERGGLMNELTVLVLDRALHDLAKLQHIAAGSTVSVNISGRNLLNQSLVPDISAALQRHGVAPASLILEVTELAPGPSLAVATAVQGLEDLGCQVSIHDFGTGQSSVTGLSQYQAIREIKIHPSLVRGIPRDPAAERLVMAIVHTAHGLGVRVVAEGVESAMVADRLRRLGCDLLQGYLFHEPAPVAVLADWAASRGADPADPADPDGHGDDGDGHVDEAVG